MTTLHAQPTTSQVPIPAAIESILLDVFQDAETGMDWIQKPHPLLDGAAPHEVLRKDHGFKRVMNLLLSTKFGGAA